MKRGLFCAILCGLTAASPLAQAISPTDAEILDAIDYGYTHPGLRYGLNLPDRRYVDTLLHIYTPLAWIYREAADRGRKYQRMTLTDIGPDFRESVLRVVADPDTPTVVSASGMAGTYSVDHIVLMNKGGLKTLQPLSTESFTREVSNALGGRATYKGLSAKFSMKALLELRGGNDQEFWVTVVTDARREVRYEIKKKLFELLP